MQLELREIEVDWHGPVASDIADAVQELISDTEADDLPIHAVDIRNDSLSLAEVVVDDPERELFGAAREALREHRPDVFEDVAELDVTDIDIEAEGQGTVTARVRTEDTEV